MVEGFTHLFGHVPPPPPRKEKERFKKVDDTEHGEVLRKASHNVRDCVLPGEDLGA